MKPTKKYLNEFNSTTKWPYTVRVKIKGKGRVQQSTTYTKYLKLALEDENGYTMFATLFNDDINTYDDLIQPHKEYDISNARITETNAAFPNMTFTGHTIIQQVTNFGGPTIPEYRTFADLPRLPSDDEEFDVAAIVLYVDRPRKINTSYGKEKDVREIVIMDSSMQTTIVSAWNDLAHTTSDLLKSATISFPIIGFTALKVRQYKGFSLSTTMSTTLTTQPQGEWPDNLKTWVASNLNILSRHQAQVITAREPPKERVVTPIKEILAKTRDDTIQEQQHWLHIYIPTFDPKEIIMYLGCSKCPKNTGYAGNMIDECPSCGEKGCMSISRILFNFKATDGSKTISLTAHAENAEKIIRATAKDLYQMSQDARNNHFLKLEKSLRTPQTYILIASSTLLSTSRILKWVLKSVEAQ